MRIIFPKEIKEIDENIKEINEKDISRPESPNSLKTTGQHKPRHLDLSKKKRATVLLYYYIIYRFVYLVMLKKHLVGINYNFLIKMLVFVMHVELDIRNMVKFVELVIMF